MESTRFDQISKLFAEQRLSRRAALHSGGVAAAAAALGIAGLTAAAQDATPAASPVSGVSATMGDNGSFLFVQSFAGGSLAPKPVGAAAADATPMVGATPETGGGAEYVLTLTQGLGDTIFFSDRPQRIVGAVPTSTFLKGLSFTPVNPPNAAFVGDLENGDQDIIVVELLNPQYDEASKTATYDVRILQDVEEVNLHFTQNPHQGQTHPAATYKESHLFIDDCSDSEIVCLTGQASNCATHGSLGKQPMCWDWSEFQCNPCRGGYDAMKAMCNQQIAACKGQCYAQTYGYPC